MLPSVEWRCKKAKPIYTDLAPLEITDGTDSSFEKMIKGENKLEVRRAIAVLPDYQKEVIILRFYHELKIRDHDLGEQYRSVLGYLPQQFGYYPNFTAYKFLMYIAAIKGLPHIKAHKRSLELLEKVALIEQKNEKIKNFSGGMKQRLGIAQALLNDPKF